MGDTGQIDDPTIRDEERLLRRIPTVPSHVTYDGNLRRKRPTSAAFSDPPDGSSMSVDLESVLADQGRPATAAIDAHAGFALAAITAGFARSQGQGIVRRPSVDNLAHAEVIGEKTKRVRTAFAKEAVWIVAPPED